MLKQQQQQQDQQQVYVEENISNLTSPPVSGEASVSSSSNRGEPSTSIYPLHHHHQQQQHQQYFSQQQQQQQQQHEQVEQLQPLPKKKRNQPGNPDPDSEVVALSPKTLLAKNRFVCEICSKGFQRDQNLQLHRRGHNLPWKLKQRSKTEVIRKKVYVCPEPSCVHHDPSRALGDLTGIKKHFCRKHGEKKWKCEKCSKKYAVQSDWKAHSKVCGTREYRCDCGTLFSRRDSFITHRAFCDALAEETARAITTTVTTHPLLTNTISALPSNSTHFITMQQQQQQQFQQQQQQLLNNQQQQDNNNINTLHAFPLKREQHTNFMTNLPPWLSCSPLDHLNSPSSSQSSIIFHQQQQQQQQQQDDHHNHNHSHNQVQQLHLQQQNQNQNPSNPRMGPTYTTTAAATTTPHMSATALLQQAAQMGATMSNNHSHVTDNSTTNTTPTTSTAGLFGLNLSSRDHQHQHHPGPSPGPSSYLHDMMVNSISSSYDDAFGMGDMGGMFKNKDNTFQLGGSRDDGGGGGGGKGNEGLTRDFLGLRPLSQNDILTIAELSNCMATNTSNSQQQQHGQGGGHKPWQN